MSVAPVSAIVVSEIVMWFGLGLHLGMKVKFLVTSKFLSLLGSFLPTGSSRKGV